MCAVVSPIELAGGFVKISQSQRRPLLTTAFRFFKLAISLRVCVSVEVFCDCETSRRFVSSSNIHPDLTQAQASSRVDGKRKLSSVYGGERAQANNVVTTPTPPPLSTPQ